MNDPDSTGSLGVAKYKPPGSAVRNLRKIEMTDAKNRYDVGQYGTFMERAGGGTVWYFHHESGRHQNASKMIRQARDIWKLPDGTRVSSGKGYIGHSVNDEVTFDSIGIEVVNASQRGWSIRFADQNTGFIVFGAPIGSAGTIVKTTDWGFTRTSLISSSVTAFYTVAGINAQTVYVSLFGGAVYKTTDGGITWVSTNATAGAANYGLVFADENTGYACGGDGAVSKTTYGGVTWKPVNTPQTN